jgi:hypothetical protein
MKLTKLFGKKSNKFVNIVLLLGVVAVIGMLYRYNQGKGMKLDTMTSKNVFANASPIEQVAGSGSDTTSLEQPTPEVNSSVVPTSTTDGDAFLPVSGMKSGSGNTGNCNNQQMMDPKDLLPKDSNNEWSDIMPQNDLKDVKMLNAGHHIGINTVGSSLRNPNLQIRSEPVIPQTNIGPWNNTTIEPDNLRRPLELGATE